MPLQLPRSSVASIMTRNVVCVRPELTLDAVMALFLETGLKAVPVVDADRKLVGFVGQVDVMLEVQTQRGENGARKPRRSVLDVMHPCTLTLPETAPITSAAALMAEHGQQRVAIVSHTGGVVGVLSASDVLYWLARADGGALPRRSSR